MTGCDSDLVGPSSDSGGDGARRVCKLATRLLNSCYLRPSMNPPLPGCHRYLNRVAPTPLVPVRLDPGLPAVWCKLEFLNPSGSTKDRIARFILEKAWRLGR